MIALLKKRTARISQWINIVVLRMSKKGCIDLIKLQRGTYNVAVTTRTLLVVRLLIGIHLRIVLRVDSYSSQSNPNSLWYLFIL